MALRSARRLVQRSFNAWNQLQVCCILPGLDAFIALPMTKDRCPQAVSCSETYFQTAVCPLGTSSGSAASVDSSLSPADHFSSIPQVKQSAGSLYGPGRFQNAPNACIKQLRSVNSSLHARTHRSLSQTSQTAGQRQLPRQHQHYSSFQLALRGFHSSIANWTDVMVPAMGDSITEGTIAAILKQQGRTGPRTSGLSLLTTSHNTYPTKQVHQSELASLLGQSHIIPLKCTAHNGQSVATVYTSTAADQAAASSPPAAARNSSTSSTSSQAIDHLYPIPI